MLCASPLLVSTAISLIQTFLTRSLLSQGHVPAQSCPSLPLPLNPPPATFQGSQPSCFFIHTLRYESQPNWSTYYCPNALFFHLRFCSNYPRLLPSRDLSRSLRTHLLGYLPPRPQKRIHCSFPAHSCYTENTRVIQIRVLTLSITSIVFLWPRGLVNRRQLRFGGKRKVLRDRTAAHVYKYDPLISEYRLALV